MRHKRYKLIQTYPCSEPLNTIYEWKEIEKSFVSISPEQSCLNQHEIEDCRYFEPIFDQSIREEIDLLKIVGLIVFALKGKSKTKRKYVEVKYILFSDNETYIEFEDQNPFAMRGVLSTKHIRTYKDKTMWKIISDYPDANNIF